MRKFSFKSFVANHYVVKEALVATTFTLIITFLISFIPIRAEFMKAIKQGFLGFDIYDIYFSGKQLPHSSRDSNIVLIELANDRTSIADQLNRIRKCHPAVIGIDAIFEHDNSDSGSIQLLQAASNSDSIVVSLWKDPGSNAFNHNFFEKTTGQLHAGYINLAEADSFSVVREYRPFLTVNDSQYAAFTSEIASRYDPEKFMKLKRRRNISEIINYIGNLESYTNLSMAEFINADTSHQLETIIKAKIVLMGYFVKDSPPVIEDLFFSPVNKHVSGKSFPDMYGVVIHANILSMVLRGDYIRQTSNFSAYFFAGLVIFLFLLYMLQEYREKGHPKHGKFMLIQFLLILLVLYLFLQAFNLFQIKVPLLPIMISLVLCLELLGVYKNMALWMHKKYEYRTVFARKHII